MRNLKLPNALPRIIAPALRPGFMACLVMATFCLTASPLKAETPSEPSAESSFQLGWFHNLTGIQRLSEIARTQAPLLIPYHDEVLFPFLDRAQSLGMTVLPEIPRSYINEKNFPAIADYVQEHDGHPAILGWYAADEPGLKTRVDWSPEVMRAVYQAIRSRSDKPVYICFSYVELDRGDVEAYSDAFDVFMVNHYPFRLKALGEENTVKALEYWKGLIARTHDIAVKLNQPWLNTLQAIGPREGRRNMGFRLPSLDEARFQLYWTVLHDAQGAIYFCYYWARRVHATEGEAFEEDGRVWIDSVLQPLMEEFKPFQTTLLNENKVEQGVQTSNAGVHARLYRNPSNQFSVLLAVNSTASPQNAKLTLPEGNWQIEPITAPAEAVWNRHQLEITLPGHGVTMYRLAP